VAILMFLRDFVHFSNIFRGFVSSKEQLKIKFRGNISEFMLLPSLFDILFSVESFSKFIFSLLQNSIFLFSFALKGCPKLQSHKENAQNRYKGSQIFQQLFKKD